MTAMDKIALTNLGISPDTIKRIFNEAVWKWYDDNADRVIVQKKIVIFTVKLRVSDLHFLFEEIAGPRPFPK